MRRYELAGDRGLDHLTVVERDQPRPGPGEVLVRVRATSLNFHDYIVVMGWFPTADGRIPMSDGAGEVVEVGEGVSEFAAGDHVISTYFADWRDGAVNKAAVSAMRGDQVDGYAAEFVVGKASDFTHAPKGLSFEQAATLPCAGLTAWRALMVEAKIKPGDVVMVLGTGGVSIFALQFARAAGATVIATTSSEAKAQKLRDLGTAHVINYSETPEWGVEATKLTDGRGVDVLLEVVGGEGITQSIAAVRTGGTIVLIGALSRKPLQFPMLGVLNKNMRLQGITVGNRREQQEMVAAIEANSIQPVVSDIFAFEQLADAFRHQEAHGHFGKIAVTI
jgi:NADPH:quinone reductase-like Zn-dependent oxidoreductase